LLRHRATISGRLYPGGIGSFNRPLEGAVGPDQALDDRLARFVRRGFIANIDVAVAHDLLSFAQV
jgi:hypothetical protein